MQTIELVNGGVAFVDDDDFERVAALRWRLKPDGVRRGVARYYVVSTNSRTRVSMHRFILGFPASAIDHVNGSTIDNRRVNLRLCTNAQNQANVRKRAGTSSRFKGVGWHTRFRRWQATIRVDGTKRFLGNYIDEVDAAVAYDAAARAAFGSFARVNFPGENERPA